MPIIKAYTLPHPPLAIPEIGHGQEKEISRTLTSFNEVAAEIADLAPDTVIFVTPHNVLYADYFHISPGSSAVGSFSRFNAANVKMSIKYDEDLINEITEIAGKSGIPAGTLGEKDSTLDHGLMVPLYFIKNRYSEFQSIRISQSGLEPSEHYKLGIAINKAVEKLDRRVVLIASSDLSHKLKNDGPYGFSPEGPEFDKAVVDALKNAEFLTLLEIPEALRRKAAECGYNSLMVLAGCFDKRQVTAKMYSYEGPFGVGYAIASFTPGKPDEGRDILARYNEETLRKTRAIEHSEDQYQALARRSLEYTVKKGADMPLPEGLPEEMTEKKAGVFVSLHKYGCLRGCIGTIAPTTGCIAKEIIQNAVSAGLHDSRFDPVKASELPFLTYKVDVLSEAEPITGPEELDVKRYGVIVTSGYKRGLLLPNIDGVDTIAEQIAIARSKAGISETAAIKLERFEVIRHE